MLAWRALRCVHPLQRSMTGHAMVVRVVLVVGRPLAIVPIGPVEEKVAQTRPDYDGGNAARYAKAVSGLHDVRCW